MCDTNVQINKLLFCFITDKNIEKHLSEMTTVMKNGKVDGIWKRENSSVSTSRDLLTEVRKLMDGDDAVHILSSFRLDKNYYNRYELKFDKAVLLPPKSPEIGFRIEAVKVHCFISGINFFELDYTVDSDKSEDINKFNYFITEIHDRVNVRFSHNTYDPETKEKTVHEVLVEVSRWISALVDKLRLKGDAYPDDSVSRKIKPLLFTYYFDRKNAITDNNIGRNYKNSYNLNVEYLHKTNYFENSTWYYSNNNVSNITNAVDDKQTNDFFCTTFLDKVNKLYFPLVLLSYYLRLYYLLVYRKLFDMKINFSGETELKDKINTLTVVKASFERVCWLYCFDSPSFIEHVNLFYTNVLSAFNVLGYKEMVSSKISFMNNYLEESSKLIVETDGKKEEIRKIRYDSLAFFAATVLSFASLLDAVSNIVGESKKEIFNGHTLFVIIGLFVIAVVINVCMSIKKIRTIRAQIRIIEEKLKLTNQTEVITSRLR